TDIEDEYVAGPALADLIPLVVALWVVPDDMNVRKAVRDRLVAFKAWVPPEAFDDLGGAFVWDSGSVSGSR
ncbi:MAG TPA: hypothetical protein VMQ59_03415, partial [Acidimicrobiales bacterium]|nr:hypothetical protein [Acidimicrobiales bacterium]